MELSYFKEHFSQLIIFPKFLKSFDPKEKDAFFSLSSP